MDKELIRNFSEKLLKLEKQLDGLLSKLENRPNIGQVGSLSQIEINKDEINELKKVIEKKKNIRKGKEIVYFAIGSFVSFLIMQSDEIIKFFKSIYK